MNWVHLFDLFVPGFALCGLDYFVLVCAPTTMMAMALVTICSGDKTNNERHVRVFVQIEGLSCDCSC